VKRKKKDFWLGTNPKGGIMKKKLGVIALLIILGLLTSSEAQEEFDVATIRIYAPTGTVPLGDTIIPRARIKNVGTDPVAWFDVIFKIGDAYSCTKTVEKTLYRNWETTVYFDPWVAQPLGTFTTRCTTCLDLDENPDNDKKTDSVTVANIPRPVSDWQKLSDTVPTTGDGKKIKGGGCITAGDKIYIIKGNNTKSFYSYLPGTTPLWIDSIPIKNKLGLRKGSGITDDGLTNIYIVPGTGTKEFWRYNRATAVWQELDSVPGIKGLKGGTGIAYQNGFVYLLKGSKTKEFYRFNIAGDSWEKRKDAREIVGTDRGYGDGSCLVSDGSYIYALRGKYNEFYQYCPEGDSWSKKESMPFIHPYCRKSKKVGEGAAMTLWNGKIYAFKGNNTKEFWMYDPANDAWVPKDTIPKGSERKYVKGGGGLCTFDGSIYAIKGNNTNVIYKYIGTTTLLASLPNTGTHQELSRPTSIRINSNPTRGFTTVYYNWPKNEMATLKIYNILGEVIYSAKTNKGLFTIRRLPAGIYLLRFKTKGYKEDKKLVVIK